MISLQLDKIGYIVVFSILLACVISGLCGLFMNSIDESNVEEVNEEEFLDPKE